MQIVGLISWKGDVMAKMYGRVINRTNEHGTCLWCGAVLKKNKYMLGLGLGSYGDDCFCYLRCAYRFALAMARSGRRLTIYQGQD